MLTKNDNQLSIFINFEVQSNGFFSKKKFFFPLSIKATEKKELFQFFRLQFVTVS
jgi:hypothetical protein